MKVIKYAFSALASLALLATFANCGGGNGDPDPTTVTFSANASSSTLNGNPLPDSEAAKVANFRISFTLNGSTRTYRITNPSNAPTPANGNSGNWSLSGTSITFAASSGAATTATVTANPTSAASGATINLTWRDENISTPAPDGKISVVAGDYVYQLTAQ